MVYSKRRFRQGSRMFKKLGLKLLDSVGLISSELKKPKSLLIYYGYPSLINGAKTVSEAVDTFKLYEYIVLGDGLSQESHGDHQKTAQIISDNKMQNSKVFGYIDAGITTQKLSIPEIQMRVDSWKSMGVAGIFLDDFGFDFRVSRDRQNKIIDYVHEKELQVIVNAWNSDDVFSITSSTLNRDAKSSHLNENDFFLLESYQVALSKYDSLSNWQKRSRKMKTYQDRLGFKTLSITTSNAPYDKEAFCYAWYSALFDEHEATGWGEINFGATDATSPFHHRPKLDDKLYFIGSIKAKDGVVKRESNLGTIEIDTDKHQVKYL